MRTYEVVYQKPATVSHTGIVELPDSERYPEKEAILFAVRSKFGKDVVSISGYAEVLSKKREQESPSLGKNPA